MTTKLDPPTVPPLPAAQRARLRNQVMAKTERKTARRRWLAPLVATAAVSAVVAGSLVFLQRPSDGGDPAVAGPSASPSIGPVGVDYGPVSQAAAAAAAEDCHVPGAGPKPLQVLWARRVEGTKPGSSLITLIVRGAESNGGDFSQGVAVCQPGIGVFMVQDVYWTRQPTRAQGATPVVSNSWTDAKITTYRQWWRIYRVRPEIVRIESRFAGGPWVRGVVADGFAYTDTRSPSSQARLTEQVRAYDAQGRPVPIQLN
ncbi:hypothetical protein ACXJJ3_00105 [Kribbella sp. WER1]